ncbi:amidase [Mesorhizobium sp. BH1-1-4]|uniref:amidase n=1 Tax=Mesorhizobium sp. BH1-1-4 TaxID=2876662 RepID=UPI001CD0967B|nr:amidase [Mesorhizobium sp. BH1-1-4]MBZ9996191.1 amidase [Mesorhizobium sp. BH1-1-4]
MVDIGLLSLTDLSRLIRAKGLSPVDITKRYLERIATLDEQLHSFNCLRVEEALEDAAEAERRIAGGGWLGPLHGIPIGIKDLIDVAGLPTTAQAEHRRNCIAGKDAGVVEALKGAGAIILGKQATAEYAVSGTQMDLGWPPVRNPWDVDLDPSSSSSGSAAAAAAGLCAGSVGTETAGSIRDPAAWCGVAGLKPTNGLVSTRGVLPLSRSMDCVGPIAWTVEDCALMISQMVSSDPQDTGIKGFGGPDISTLSNGIRGLRIGVVRHFYEDAPDIDDDVLDAMEGSLITFEKLGARLSTVRLAEFDAYCAAARSISWPEEYAEHCDELEAHPDRFHPVSRSRLQDGREVMAADYIRARRRQASLTAEMGQIMWDIDVLVLPTNKKPAQVLGYEHTPLRQAELSLTRPFNLTGGPALTLCNGFTASGLPTSIQIIGRRFEDDTVLKVGHALETALGLRKRRPGIAAL